MDCAHERLRHYDLPDGRRVTFCEECGATHIDGED